MTRTKRASSRRTPARMARPAEQEGDLLFHLQETLNQHSGDRIKAWLYIWDPKANGGLGRYDLDQNVEIIVGDTLDLGFGGYGAQRGRCRMIQCGDGTQVGEILDMECI